MTNLLQPFGHEPHFTISKEETLFSIIFSPYGSYDNIYNIIILWVFFICDQIIIEGQSPYHLVMFHLLVASCVTILP